MRDGMNCGCCCWKKGNEKKAREDLLYIPAGRQCDAKWCRYGGVTFFA